MDVVKRVYESGGFPIKFYSSGYELPEEVISLISKIKVKQLEHPIQLVVSGPLGVGKTTLASVIAREYIRYVWLTSKIAEERFPMFVFSGKLLVFDRKFGWTEEDTEARELMETSDFLVIDDITKVAANPTIYPIIEGVIRHRWCNDKHLVLTSQVPKDQLDTAFSVGGKTNTMFGDLLKDFKEIEIIGGSHRGENTSW